MLKSKTYVGDLRRNYVAYHASKQIENFWSFLTDRELVKIINIIEEAKHRGKNKFN